MSELRTVEEYHERRSLCGEQNRATMPNEQLKFAICMHRYQAHVSAIFLFVLVEEFEILVHHY